VRTGAPPASNGPDSERFFRSALLLYKVPVLRDVIRRQLEKYANGDLELAPVLQEPYPAPERFQPWETCMTLGQSWAYNPDETAWKTPGTLIRNLVEVVSRGGNYLLNVGPTARGVFPPEAVARLQAVGRWMAANHEAVYGSDYTPLQRQPWGQATRKGNKLYLHVFAWPTDGRLIVEAFPGAARAVALMAGDPLSFTQSAQRLEIALPTTAPAPDVSVLAVEMSS
jgi:alpha-L-fucosidase